MDNTAYRTAKEQLTNAYGSLEHSHRGRALGELRLAAKSVAPDLARDIDALEARYFYMLRFVAQGNEHQDLDVEQKRIEREARTIARRIEMALNQATGTSLYSGRLRYAAMRPEENLESLFSDYLAELDRLGRDTAALTDSRKRTELERLASDIFYRLWIEFPFTDDGIRIADSMLADSTIPVYDRVLWVHALGLNRLTYDTVHVAQMLGKAYGSADSLVSTAAAVWLALTAASPETSQESIPVPLDQEDNDAILLQWARSLGTGSLSDDIARNIMPRMQQLGQEIQDRISSGDADSIEAAMMGENLDLGVEGYDMMKQFVDAQKKGDDVFMSTLGRMRHFAFFNRMSNWFLPFHTAHSAIAEVVDAEGASLADLVSKMPNLCDSDKYAMMLNIVQLPPQARAATMTHFAETLRQMADQIPDADLSDVVGEAGRDTLIGLHIKNLYRFFHLFPQRGEFVDPLAGEPHKSAALRVTTDDMARQLASMYMGQQRYRSAIKMYGILQHHEVLSPQDCHRMGYAYEMLGQAEEAIHMYELSLSIAGEEHADIRTIRRLAALMISLRRYSSAVLLLTDYDSLTSVDPESLRLKARAYLNYGQIPQALNAQQNLDYILPEGDTSAKEMLAWLLTVDREYETAEEVFGALDPTAVNLRRHAILKWLTGHASEAVAMIDRADELDARSGTKSSLHHDPGYRHLAQHPGTAPMLAILDDVVAYHRNGSQYGNILQ